MKASTRRSCLDLESRNLQSSEEVTSVLSRGSQLRLSGDNEQANLSRTGSCALINAATAGQTVS